MTQETALVTGACGFVGSHMTAHLAAKGYRVVATDHPGADRRRLAAGIEFIPADITRPESLEALGRAEIHKIFHVAAVFDYLASQETLERVNCQGTRHLLEFLSNRRSSIRHVVVWSSGSVYGRNFKRAAVTEKDATDPINPYERSKLLQETIALDFQKTTGLPVTVIRPSAIYGPQSRYGMAVPVFLIRKGLLRFVPGDGRPIGSFAHVDDVVGAAEFLSARPEAAGEIYNVSDDSSMMIEDALCLAADLMGVRFFRAHIPLPPLLWAAWIDETVSRMLRRRPLLERDLIEYMRRNFWMDNSKLKSLGYAFKYPTLRSGLPGTIEWYRRAGWI
ncbi:MAG: NAD(P)-dependent oxidoreductase [Elusimicrobia bacterium]|nr:NAD(P)-dependent oxidoreductase [Elusimicrobiota bacterium]